MGRTCKFHGEAHGPGVYACDNQASGFHWCEEDATADNSPGCFVPLATEPATPAPAPVEGTPCAGRGGGLGDDLLPAGDRRPGVS